MNYTRDKHTSLMKKEFGSDTSMIKIKKMVENRMMHFEVPFDRPEDLDDFIDNFQEKFEEAFEDKEYIIAGFFNYKESFDGVDRLPSYDAFWVYSLCHFKFSYTLFDNDGGRPEAGLFAPCSMYMYIKKDSNTLVVGMPRLANWAATLGIVEPGKVALVEQLDKEIPEIMVSLGAKDIGSINATKKVVVTTKKSPVSPVDTAEKKSDDSVDTNNTVIIKMP